MNNTYHIIGTLQHSGADLDTFMYGSLPPLDRQINDEIEAANVLAAIDSLETGGWFWRGGEVDVFLVTEATRMEAAGQATLFPLPAAEIRQLRLL